ncbi:hypothetical protein AXG93_2396s1340 [Marchantia polymorpha subsp. ruderalis]|uniref:Uncharacterized protein n=1 Tax=Marchantia polymorpha subsp. ruderalis TaxID=1480154 RepID=A0A176VEF9_MARPO|nr:hypothetical protein AXG93_2396s1340 [Marchantia polymorpha subsp. ruderalis]
MREDSMTAKHEEKLQNKTGICGGFADSGIRFGRKDVDGTPSKGTNVQIYSRIIRMQDVVRQLRPASAFTFPLRLVAVPTVHVTRSRRSMHRALEVAESTIQDTNSIQYPYRFLSTSDETLSSSRNGEAVDPDPAAVLFSEKALLPTLEAQGVDHPAIYEWRSLSTVPCHRSYTRFLSQCRAGT